VRIGVVLATFMVLVSAAVAQARTEATCLAGRQAAMLVRYERTGGLAGTRDLLTVRRSGSATLVRHRGSNSTTLRLSCAKLRTLRTALVNARFASLSPVYSPDDPYADGFIESISYGGRTVRVFTGSEPPARLARVLGLLRALASREQ
jgi:hypothetical protein